jgi:hypothetical protein
MDCPEYENVKNYANYLLCSVSVVFLLGLIAIYALDRHLRGTPGKLIVMFHSYMLLAYICYVSTWPALDE